jgi:hypothetical protein
MNIEKAGMHVFSPIQRHKIGEIPSVNMDDNVMNLETIKFDLTKLPSQHSLVANDPLRA